MERPWLKDAACRGLDVSLFYTTDDVEATRESNSDTNRVALRFCKTCPVKAECLDYALKHEIEGIWGGTLPVERRHMRAKLKIAVKDPRRALEATEMCGTDAGWARHYRASKAGLEGYPIGCLPCRQAHSLATNTHAARKRLGK